MIYAKLNYGGRIGNMLFIIGAGLTHAKRMGADFRGIVNSRYEGYTEQFFDNIFKGIEFVYELPADIKIYEATNFHYDELPLEDNICLYSWFQSEKYLDRELILSHFRMSDERREQIMAKYPVLDEPNVTAINVRRGDFLQFAAHFPSCSIAYYNRCMKLMGDKGKFLICSDDIEWCKKNFHGENISFVENSDILTDLYIQTLCANNIISNSTFSWWGAWLNENPNKRVLAPKNWFGPAYKRVYDSKDVIPVQWQKVNNKLTLAQRIFVGKHYLKQAYIWACRLLPITKNNR